MTDSNVGPGAAPPAATKANVLWFLPTHGDGRYLGTTIGARDVTLNYLAQVAKAADHPPLYVGGSSPAGQDVACWS